jgi:hypothetical protein
MNDPTSIEVISLVVRPRDRCFDALILTSAGGV